MEMFSRVLPLTASRFSATLRNELLADKPLVFEEDLSASYIARQSYSYTHNLTRAAIAITAHYRLVVMNGSAKKIDIPLQDPKWFSAVTVWSDKPDRINFKVHLGVAGTGTVGSSLQIKVKTHLAARISAIAQAARNGVPSDEVMELSAHVRGTAHAQNQAPVRYPVQPTVHPPFQDEISPPSLHELPTDPEHQTLPYDYQQNSQPVRQTVYQLPRPSVQVPPRKPVLPARP